MSAELADYIDGTPGRFVPEVMRGELVEAEHLTRYWWAASLAAGRRVLDAGCGTGYGSALLAQAGAAEVTGIDLAEEVVSAISADAPAGVTFRSGDVMALPFPDDAFDLVVCFEVIEHVEDRDRALDEIRRVLAPGGVVAISSPNREVYVPGNPHHHEEYTPPELEAALLARWSHAQLFQQHNFVTTAMLERAGDPSGQLRRDIGVRQLAGKRPGEETYTVALASDAALDPPGELATLAAPVEVRHWLELYQEQQRVLERQAEELDAARRLNADRGELLARLADAEAALAEIPELRAQAEASARLAEELARLQARVERADRVHTEMITSASWKVTAPLRVAKQAVARAKDGRP